MRFSQLLVKFAKTCPQENFKEGQFAKIKTHEKIKKSLFTKINICEIFEKKTLILFFIIKYELHRCLFLTLLFLEERSNVFAPIGFLSLCSLFQCLFSFFFRLYIKIDINVLSEATHYRSSRKQVLTKNLRMTDSRKLNHSMVYPKYLEKADSRKSVLAKFDFLNLAKINSFKANRSNTLLSNSGLKYLKSSLAKFLTMLSNQELRNWKLSVNLILM